ncbi:ATP-binding cassette domain-containing protein [Paenibacillus sp. P26]|nr:ATP-binding cassette domain-containing protein [Paenibacillus sp. P26]
MILHPQELLRLEGVSCSLPSAEGTRYPLRGIDLTVRRGEWLAVAGPNGAGKSTLAKVMAGLFKPAEGQVCRFPHESDETDSFIQLVFQNPDTHLFGETVYEEVVFGLEQTGAKPKQVAERATEALREVGLLAKAHAPVSSLSGGQKRLLAGAGRLALRPAVLLFDEATSMLDPLSREQLLGLARKFHRAGTAIVWITQLLDELPDADRVAALDKGRIVFTGTAEEFFTLTSVHQAHANSSASRLLIPWRLPAS